MFEFITHPLFRSIVESRIKSAFVDNDPNKTRLKQWLAVANDGKFSKETWGYQFYGSTSLATRLKEKAAQQMARGMGVSKEDAAKMKEMMSDQHAGNSLADFALNTSDQLIKTARKPKWYQRMLGRILRGKNYRQTYLNESQDYYKKVLEIWKNNQSAESTSQNKAQREAREKAQDTGIKLNWFQALLLWCVKQSGVKWTFKSKDFTNEEDLFEKFRTHEENAKPDKEALTTTLANKLSSGEKLETPSLSAGPSPVQLFDPAIKEHTHDLLLRRMKGVREEGENKKEGQDGGKSLAEKSLGEEAPQTTSHLIPPHMKEWLIDLTLTQSVDQTHQHQHAVSQQQQVDAAQQRNALQRVQEAQKWTDESEQKQWNTPPIDKVHYYPDPSRNTRWLPGGEYAETRECVNTLYEACYTLEKEERNESALSKTFTKLNITENALEALKEAKGHIKGDKYDFDLDWLPLGFFVDKETTTNDMITFTLKYSEAYRLHQLA